VVIYKKALASRLLRDGRELVEALPYL